MSPRANTMTQGLYAKLYDTLARSLGWQSWSGPGWQSHKNVTLSPVGHVWLPIWLRPVTAKQANNQWDNVHISNSTTPIVLIWVSARGQLRDCSHSVRYHSLYRYLTLYRYLRGMVQFFSNRIIPRRYLLIPIYH